MVHVDRDGAPAPPPFRLRDGLYLFLRFAAIAPVCMVAWWLALPYYAWLPGAVSAGILRWVLQAPVTGIDVHAEGILNTGTQLITIFGERRPGLEIVHVASNLPAFVALTLATTKIQWRRRLYILLIGCAVLALTHVIYLTMVGRVYVQGALGASVGLPTALSQLFIALPFPLWLLLAYWERFMGILHPVEDDPTEDT